MKKEKIYIFDTTLRDGAQTEGVDFSIEDKNKIANVLSDIGIDYVEGGWPGANPVDTKFFSNPPKMKKTIFTAFGMTKKTGRSADNDPGLASLINANTPAVCVVGKSWDFHVKVALGIKNEENLENISETTKHFVKKNKEFLFDAEHFFDGYKSNPNYALDCLKQAYDNGARWIVLCDTNGGTLPNEIREIVSKVSKTIPGKNLGIHAHNDTENAVANSLAAVECGVRQIQGTINGLGERCGNANLMSIIPNLCLKKTFSDKFELNIKKEKLSSLTECSRLLDEILNRKPNKNMAYVGASAFSHKGGLHVSAVKKDPKTYEHIDPKIIGNHRNIIISNQSGRSNIISRLEKYGVKIDSQDPKVQKILDEVKIISGSMPLMAMYHANLGFPFSSEGAKLMLDKKDITSKVLYQDGITTHPTDKRKHIVKLISEYGPALDLEFEGSTFPVLQVLRNFKPGVGLVCLEPATHERLSRAQLMSKGDLPTVATGESCRFGTTFRFYPIGM